MAKDKIVDDPMGKVFNKIGITGIASALMTLILGFIIIWFRADIQLSEIVLLVGLYLVIVGFINLFGYVWSVISKNKAQKTYIETETFKFKLKEEATEEEQK